MFSGVIYYFPSIEKQINEVVRGDMLNLENDSIADTYRTNIKFRYELYVVDKIEYGFDNCAILRNSSNENFTFPLNHIVSVWGHDSGC
jgi:hypothetical protein